MPPKGRKILTPELKTRLKASGLWPDFQKRREQIKHALIVKEDIDPGLSDVMKSKIETRLAQAAIQQTVEEYMPRLLEIEAGKEQRKAQTDALVASAPPIAPKYGAFNKAKAAAVPATEDTAPLKASAITKVTRETFANRPKATIRQEMEWVATNIGFREPDVDSCPSAAAWGMYISYIGEKEKFWDRYTKLKEEGAASDTDGGGDLRDLISKAQHASLLDAKDAAKGVEPVEEDIPDAAEAG